MEIKMAESLAEHLGISEEQLQKDIDVLSQKIKEDIKKERRVTTFKELNIKLKNGMDDGGGGE